MSTYEFITADNTAAQRLTPVPLFLDFADGTLRACREGGDRRRLRVAPATRSAPRPADLL